MRKRFLDIIVVVITEAMIILGVTLRFTTKMLRLVRMCLGDDDDDDDDGDDDDDIVGGVAVTCGRDMGPPA